MPALAFSLIYGCKGAFMDLKEIDLTTLDYDFITLNDNFFDDKTNNEICINHLLYVSDCLEYGYILDDLYNRLIYLYFKHFDEKYANTILDSIMNTSINHCEYFFRLFNTKGVYANDYPNLTNNGYIWAIISFGYLLPYYISFDETTEQLPIAINDELIKDRSPTLDNSPHVKALHSAHQTLDILKNILDYNVPITLHQLGNRAYSKQSKDKFKQLEQYYLEILPQLKRNRVSKTTEQTKLLLKRHNHNYYKLGYEHSYLVKKIGELKRKHFK